MAYLEESESNGRVRDLPEVLVCRQRHRPLLLILILLPTFLPLSCLALPCREGLSLACQLRGLPQVAELITPTHSEQQPALKIPWHKPPGK